MKKNPTLVVPEADEVSPDAETVIDDVATPVPVRTRPDPLDAAEQALAKAAQARGVPLELPDRVPPDRTDVFAAAERALAKARKARQDADPRAVVEDHARRVLDKLKKRPDSSPEQAADEDAPATRPKRDL